MRCLLYLTSSQCLPKDNKETLITQNQASRHIFKIWKYEFSVNNAVPSEYSERLKQQSIISELELEDSKSVPVSMQVSH